MESNLLILLFTLSIVSSQNFSPGNYFISCGSNSNITFTGKTFIGDENLPPLSFSGGRMAVNNNPPSPIYRTARVFTHKSWYELIANKSNTFMMVRLYFSPYFSYGSDLSDSKFDVSVSGFSLLSNFNVGVSPMVKEFIIPIGSKRKFRIEFTPSNDSSPAFVNAIEAFTIPYELFKHDASLSHISPNKGYTGEMDDISSSYVFMPIYRINVGGQSIEVEHDTLRRNWTPDDPFIVKSERAKNISFSGTPNYADGSATGYDAPDDVYKTAKQLSVNSSIKIVSWNFTVNKNAMYLVRAHFYDFTSQDGLTNAYNLFIYRKYKKEINPRRNLKSLQVPFYIDFVVHSAELGFVNVSIGTIPNISQSALLNGLEIMELLGLHDNLMRNIVVGCVIIGVVIFVLLTCFFIGLKFPKTKPMQETRTESNTVPLNSWSSYTSMNSSLMANGPSQIPKMSLNLRFQFADILQATNSFDESLVIGKGGFGKVYRGYLPNGKTVAVKRGEKGHGQGRPEFVKEIMVLSKIQHQHLVTLLGYCDEKSEMILVYEYMEMGTLQEHLYGMNKDAEKLSWSQRLEICIGATQGLHYLHTGSEHGIIHGDVKSTNILLNENYIAKVADFGISRFDNLEESEMGIKGSFGYLDPEYISCMQLTKKSDVYSFGVVLLEVLCARPALDIMLPKNEANLADWAIKQIKNGMVEMIIDPYLVDQIKPNSLRKYLETVEVCLKNTGDERPSMIDVLWDLNYALKYQQLMANNGTLADSTVNTLLMFSMSMIDRLPSKCNDDNSQVNDTSYNDNSQATDTDYPSESQVFSQLKIDEAR